MIRLWTPPPSSPQQEILSPAPNLPTGNGTFNTCSKTAGSTASPPIRALPTGSSPEPKLEECTAPRTGASPGRRWVLPESPLNPLPSALTRPTPFTPDANQSPSSSPMMRAKVGKNSPPSAPAENGGGSPPPNPPTGGPTCRHSPFLPPTQRSSWPGWKSAASCARKMAGKAGKRYAARCWTATP